MTLSPQLALEKQTNMNVFKFAKDANEKQKKILLLNFFHVTPILILLFFSFFSATLLLRAQTVLFKVGVFSSVA